MEFSLKTGSLLFILLFLAACNDAPVNIQPTLTKQVSFPTQSTTPKATFTHQPTRTHTPQPSATLTPLPRKEVLAQFGVLGGDGDWYYYAFVGRNTPKMILYTDGQLIVQKEDSRGIWFEESTLTTPQMCEFLSQVENTGFFNLEINPNAAYPTENPIYKFNDTTGFSEGGASYFIQVNGPKHRDFSIYYDYAQYLIPDAKKILNLFNNYSPPTKPSYYQPQYLLLRIEKGLSETIYVTPTPIAQTWDTDLPSLEILAAENFKIAGVARYTVIKNEQVNPVLEAFGNRLTYKLFQSGDQVYYVGARPLLPHEDLYNFAEIPREKEFALPFNCSN